MSALLIACLGNIFKGDDAFGVEVARRLAGRELPPDVDLVDFGIRGIDLTYALLDRYDAAVLVDTTCQGGLPGTIYVIEPEAGEAAPEELMLAAARPRPRPGFAYGERDGRALPADRAGGLRAGDASATRSRAGWASARRSTAAVDEAIRVIEDVVADLRDRPAATAAANRPDASGNLAGGTR